MSANYPDETLSCAILPLRNNDGILIPASAMVEVIDRGDLNVVVDLQEGVMGKMQWKNTAIPLISYAAASGLEQAAFNTETRAVVVRVAIDDVNLQYIAFAAHGVPKFVELSEPQIKEVLNEDDVENDLSEARVQVDGQLLWVPDMSAIVHHIENQVI